MSEARKMERIVKAVLQERELRRHLSDGALVRYHDGRLDNTELRWHIERHLELCTSCRERSEAVTHIHLSEEELIDYHDGHVSNPHTLARIRAHLETERCSLCTNWLAEFQQAEDEAAAWLTTQALVSEEETPAAVAQGLGAMMQRLARRAQRPWAVVTALLHPPLAPAAVHATTTYPRVHVAPGGELTCVINKTEDGGLTLTFENQRVEWAGGLLEFACCTAETGEVLLSGFSVLPEAPRSASESAVCLSPEAVVQLETAFQVVVYPIGLEELTDDDVESLRWSATIAADEASHEAWRAFAGRLREGAPASSPLHAWAEEVARALGQDQTPSPMAEIAGELQQERPGAPAGNVSQEDISDAARRLAAMTVLVAVIRVQELAWRRRTRAVLGTESEEEREAEFTVPCPGLEGVPGIAPRLTVRCRRRGEETRVDFWLERREHEALPPDFRVELALRRSHPRYGPRGSVKVQLTAPDAWAETVHLHNVVNRETWELEGQWLPTTNGG